MAKRINLNPLNMAAVSDRAEWYTIVVKHNYEKKFADDLLKAVTVNNMFDIIQEIVAPLKEEAEIVTN